MCIFYIYIYVRLPEAAGSVRSLLTAPRAQRTPLYATAFTQAVTSPHIHGCTHSPSLPKPSLPDDIEARTGLPQAQKSHARGSGKFVGFRAFFLTHGRSFFSMMLWLCTASQRQTRHTHSLPLADPTEGSVCKVPLQKLLD